MPSDNSASVRPLSKPPDVVGPRRRQTHVIRRRPDRRVVSRPREVNRANTASIGCMVVAIPARNEAASIADCLTSIDRAARGCRMPVVVTVAADGCRDETAAIARATPTVHSRVTVIEGLWHGAGRARAAAVDSALADLERELSAVWVANTDADCVVPANWLRRQLRAANSGIHAVAGVVALDPTTTPDSLLARFAATYDRRGPTHRHVHGANVGLRADCYRLVGGWSTHTVIGEDHDLWRRLMAANLHLGQPTDLTVTTSSRTSGRVAGGFASRLSRLGRQAPYQARPAS